MKKKLLYVAPMALALLLAACGETQVEKVDNGSKTEQKAEKKEKKKDEIYKVGDTVKVNGVEITINSAKLSNGEQYNEPKNGKVLTLNITAKNTSDTQAFVDSNEFNLYSGDTQQENYFGAKTHISGDLNKGKKLSGVIQYDVKGSGTYEVIYSPTFALDSKEIKWKIDVK